MFKPRLFSPRGSRFALIVAVVTALVACSGGTATSSGTSAAGSSKPVASSAASTAASSAPLWSEPSDAGLPAATVSQLQAALKAYVTAHSLTGLAAAVVTSKGSWAGATGVDGLGTAIQPTSAFAIASTTKTFTAAEILLLSSQGKIDLDAPVTTYVSLPFETNGATVRQLATMKSGFPEAPWPAIMAEVAKDPNREWTAAEVVAKAADQPRLGTLGGPAKYNGVNYYVLGLVIEKVTGRSLAAALREDLLAPAKLDRIWMQPGDRPQPPLAFPVDDAVNKIVAPASGFLPSPGAASTGQGGAGIAADAPSLARWGYLLYGGHVIGSDLVTVMETADPSGEFRYGFGTMNLVDGGTTIVGHAGNFIQYTSIMLVWPGTATSIAVLVPQTGGAENDARGDLAFELYSLLQSAGS